MGSAAQVWCRHAALLDCLLQPTGCRAAGFRSPPRLSPPPWMRPCSWTMRAPLRPPGRSDRKRSAPAWRQVRRTSASAACCAAGGAGAPAAHGRQGSTAAAPPPLSPPPLGGPTQLACAARAACCACWHHPANPRLPALDAAARPPVALPPRAGIGGAAAPESAAVAVQQSAADYYTQEEMAKVRFVLQFAGCSPACLTRLVPSSKSGPLPLHGIAARLRCCAPLLGLHLPGLNNIAAFSRMLSVLFPPAVPEAQEEGAPAEEDVCSSSETQFHPSFLFRHAVPEAQEEEGAEAEEEGADGRGAGGPGGGGGGPRCVSVPLCPRASGRRWCSVLLACCLRALGAEAVAPGMCSWAALLCCCVCAASPALQAAAAACAGQSATLQPRWLLPSPGLRRLAEQACTGLCPLLPAGTSDLGSRATREQRAADKVAAAAAADAERRARCTGGAAAAGWLPWGAGWGCATKRLACLAPGSTRQLIQLPRPGLRCPQV